ncbi:MAG: sialidase family protein [Patescibacteria group bacterium]
MKPKHIIYLPIFLFLIIFLIFISSGYIITSQGKGASKIGISLKVNKKEIAKGKKVKLSGFITPRQKGVKVSVHRKYKNQKHYKKIAAVKTKKRGAYGYSAKPSRTAYFKTSVLINKQRIYSKAVKVKVISSTPEILCKGLTSGNQLFKSLAVSPSNSDIIYVGSEGNGIFKSIDGGNNWQWQRSGLICSSASQGTTDGYYAEIFDVAINPSDESIVFAGTTNGPGPATGNWPSALAGVYRSTNAGSTWEQKVSGLENGAIVAPAINPSNPQQIFLSVSPGNPTFPYDNVYFEGRLYKSDDNGNNWTKLPFPQSERTDNAYWQIYFRGNTIYTNGLKYIYHEDRPHEKVPAESLGIIKSTDSGNTWTRLNQPAGTFLNNFDVAQTDQNIIYANETDVYKIYKTQDGGTNWSEISMSNASGVLRISPQDSNTVLFSDAYGLYKTTDGFATSKTVIPDSGRIYDIVFAPSNPNIVYAGAVGYNIYKSTDGGEIFIKVANLRDFINQQPQ